MHSVRKRSLICPLNAVVSFLALLITTSAWADTVDPAGVTVFQPGTTVDSSDVNDTLQALIAAINDNSARLDALETANRSTVAGRTYRLHQIGILNRGDSSGGSSVANLSQFYTVTFNANGTYSFVGTENEGELTIPTGAVNTQSLDSPVSFTGTFTQTGETVSALVDGDAIELVAALNGTVILISQFTVEAEDDSAFTRSESSFLVGVEIAP